MSDFHPRPTRSGSTVALLALACMLPGCGGGGGGGAGFLPPDLTPESSPNFGLFLRGGSGGPNGGEGGQGARATISFDQGSGGDVEIRQLSTADASFAFAPGTPVLGAVPLVISVSRTLAVVVAEPAAGTPYLLDGDTNLYVSDGDTALGDEPPVTGVRVDPGVVWTLERNTCRFGACAPRDTARIALVADLDNRGVITPSPGPTRGDLHLELARYLGFGSLNTAGDAATTVGGRVTVAATGSIWNQGPITSFGADTAAGAAGSGGIVHLAAGGVLQNVGPVQSYGGVATAGAGGAGGRVRLEAAGDLWNAGAVSAAGGSGTTSGGPGGRIRLEVYDEGELRNAGTLDGTGGSASGGSGGAGGRILLYAEGGDLRTSGAISAPGGNATDTSSAGGDGGSLRIQLTCIAEAVAPAVPRGALLVSGNLSTEGGHADATAGSSGNGGHAGNIEIRSDCSDSVAGQRLALLGYTGIATRGGDGEIAGNGGAVVIRNRSSRTAAGVVQGHGGIHNEALWITQGGDQTRDGNAGRAGHGGAIDLDMGREVAAGPVAPVLTNTGAWFANGGAAQNTTVAFHRGGPVYAFGLAGLTNSGDVDSTGGNDTGSDGGVDGIGAAGGDLTLAAGGGTLSNTATLQASGGNGEFVGGNGGDILLSVEGPAVLGATGTRTSAAGSGATPGLPGAISP